LSPTRTYVIKWSILSAADRNAIFEYTQANSSQAAALVDDRIRLSISKLRKSPGIGRPGRVKGTRELLIQRTPYIAAYRVYGGGVRILRILHGAQQWPDEISE
jgi:toxin ParE1/3/4